MLQNFVRLSKRTTAGADVHPVARGTPPFCAQTFLFTALLTCAVGVLQADGTNSRVWRSSNVVIWSLGRLSQNSAPAVTVMSRHQTRLDGLLRAAHTRRSDCLAGPHSCTRRYSWRHPSNFTTEKSTEDICSDAQDTIGCLVSVCSSIWECLQSDGFPSRETSTMARTAQEEPPTSHKVLSPSQGLYGYHSTCG